MRQLSRIFKGRDSNQIKPLYKIISDLWKNGEQGVWYDIEGFRDAWNSVGPNITPSTAQVFGEASVLSPGVYRIYSSAGAFSSVSAVTTGSAVIGRKYIISFNVDSITTLGSGLTIESVENPTVTTIGPKSFLVTAVNTSLHIKRNSACDIQISGLSAKEWTGQNQCALYQDAAGTLPVYMPGQGQVDPPVGMLLDKRLGFALGPERITNTEFQTLNGWTAVRGASATVSGGVVTVTTANPQDWGSVSTPIATEPGKSYLVKVLMTSGNGQNVQLLVSESAVNHVNITNTGSARNVTGYYSLVFKATKTVHYVWLGSSTNTAAVNVSSWAAPSVREISANYAYQTTTTSRPTLSARYNLLTKSEDLSDAAVWATQVSGTGSAPVRTKDYAAAPNGSMTATRLQLALNGGAAASDRSGVAQTVSSTTTGAGYGCAIWLKAASEDSVGRVVLLRHMAGTTYLPCVLTAEWKAFGRVEAAATNYGVVTLELRGASGGASDSVDMLVWGADLRAANDGVGLPPYQRVVDANTYDTVGFPLYLRFDGVDDFLQTASVDFSGTDKLFATAALRKLSDSAAGIVVELSSVSNTNNGSFALLAPAGPGDTFAVYMRGATALTTSVPSGAPSPASRVFTGVMDTSAAVGRQSRSRLNGAHYAYASQDSGGGNFGSYPLYIGRRGGTGLPFNGRLYSLLIRGTATPDATIAQVERYLNQKARIY